MRGFRRGVNFSHKNGTLKYKHAPEAIPKQHLRLEDKGKKI